MKLIHTCTVTYAHTKCVHVCCGWEARLGGCKGGGGQGEYRGGSRGTVIALTRQEIFSFHGEICNDFKKLCVSG